MDDFKRLDQLLERVGSGEASAPDFQTLRTALDQGDDAVLEKIHAFHQARAAADPATAKPYDAADWQDIVRGILAVDKQAGELREPSEPREHPAVRRIPRARRWWAAAAILILCGAGYWLLPNHPAQPPLAQQPNRPAHDAPPGGNKAVLTLSGGRQIILDSAANGALAQQGATKVIKSDSGSLTYQLSHSPLTTDPSPQYNTLSTPRGGQYQLTLPDGTKVWLNAASSITYPTAFTGPDRAVTITGEVYFDVTQNKSMPFTVHTPQSSITVLGTEFNVNAYADEQDIRTTLVSGAVKFNGPHAALQLRPGQQTIFDPLTHRLSIGEADTEKAIAWKNGRFEFGHTGLAPLLRQISRWYDIDIAYETDKYDGAHFSGGLNRNLNLSHVLRLLETGGVHYKIVAKKIIIIP